MKHIRQIIFLFFLLVGLGMLPQGTTSAQEPIAINEIKQGQVISGSPLPTYSFSASEGEVIEVEILGIAQGFIPQFTILKPDNTALGVWYALNQVTGFKSLVQIPDAGQYRLQVNNAGDPAQGLFVVTMRPAVLPTELVRDTPRSGELSSGQNANFVVEANTSQPLHVGITILNSVPSIEATLKDPSGAVIATLGNQLYGGAFNIPVGRGRYAIELHNTALEQSTISYTVNLSTLGSAEAAEGTAPSTDGTASGNETTMVIELRGQQITVPILPVDGDCVIAASLEHADHNHNVRNGPSMASAVFDNVDPTAVYNVVGRNNNRSWYQIEINGNVGWVTYNHMRLGGNCDVLPVRG